MSDPAGLIEAVRERLGAKAVITDRAEIEPWLIDWRGRFHGEAQAILAPASTEEVATIVALAAERRVPLVPQGGNTSMVGGATPPADGSALILSLRRMNRVRSIDVGVAVADAGMILADLHEAAAESGQRFPLTLGARGSCTIGGVVATNAGGTQVLRFGTMRSLVLGLEAVLPDGSVHDGLSGLKKDNRGYNLDQLLVGSEGTLGIVTAATLKLESAVAARSVIWAGVGSIAAARELLLHCQAAEGDALEGFEVLPGHCLASVLRFLPDARAPLTGEHAWHALIELDAGEREVDGLAERAEAMIAAAFERGLVADAVIAQNEAQAEAFWQLREMIAPAERAAGPAVQHDVSVPLESVPGFVEAAVPAVEARWPGTRAVAFGHLGDGNVHFHVIAPAGADGPAWQDSDGKAISRFVHDLVAEWKGSISAEHGIGQLKRDELKRLGDPVALAMMEKVKAALDPLGIMNPGKLL